MIVLPFADKPGPILNTSKMNAWLNLEDLQRLRHLDLSNNPALTPDRAEIFSWWQVLSEHPCWGERTL